MTDFLRYSDEDDEDEDAEDDLLLAHADSLLAGQELSTPQMEASEKVSSFSLFKCCLSLFMIHSSPSLTLFPLLSSLSPKGFDFRPAILSFELHDHSSRRILERRLGKCVTLPCTSSSSRSSSHRFLPIHGHVSS